MQHETSSSSFCPDRPQTSRAHRVVNALPDWWPRPSVQSVISEMSAFLHSEEQQTTAEGSRQRRAALTVDQWGKTLVRGEATLNIWNEKDNSTVHTRATTHSLCFVSFLEMIKWLRAAVPQTLRLQSSDLDIGAFSPQKCWLKSWKTIGNHQKSIKELTACKFGSSWIQMQKIRRKERNPPNTIVQNTK